MQQKCAKILLKNAETRLMSKIQRGINFPAHKILKCLFLYIWFVKDLEYAVNLGEILNSCTASQIRHDGISMNDF